MVKIGNCRKRDENHDVNILRTKNRNNAVSELFHKVEIAKLDKY